MHDWWYWALYALAALIVFVGVPLTAWLERRADERDRALWIEMFRATR